MIEERKRVIRACHLMIAQPENKQALSDLFEAIMACPLTELAEKPPAFLGSTIREALKATP